MKATYFTRAIKDLEWRSGNVYDGHFPCPDECYGLRCLHGLECDVEKVGFPFELDAKVGAGGSATVYKGRFHQEEAAYKFIPLVENGFEYWIGSVGCWEYDKQVMILIMSTS